jgi:catechol 2,3-dioxygenase-like lactoylglutathione lyase family enzyme
MRAGTRSPCGWPFHSNRAVVSIHRSSPYLRPRRPSYHLTEAACQSSLSGLFLVCAIFGPLDRRERLPMNTDQSKELPTLEARPHSILGTERPAAERDRGYPRFRLHSCTVFVRSMDRALRFYLDQLGFRLVGETDTESGRWRAIAPPDGTAVLVLIEPEPDSEEYQLIGQSRRVIFVAEDVAVNFQAWSNRRVRFHQPPQPAAWGGLQTRFEDPDGNSFVLVGYDAATREFEAQRRAAQELDIAKQVQSRLFPQRMPRLKH